MDSFAKMIIELFKAFFSFAGAHPFLIFFTAPFWLGLFALPIAVLIAILATITDVAIAFIGLFQNKK